MEDITPTDPAQFNDCLFHLLYYKARTNGFNVPRDDLPKLHAFLQHLKKEYKHYMVKMGEDPSEPNPDEFPPSVLTPQQVAVLESLHIPVTSRGDEHWLRFFSLLEDWKKEHGHVLVPRLCEVPGLGDWVTDQRRQYKSWKQGYPSQLTEFRRNRLESLGFAWSVRDRPEWDTRFKVRMLVWTRALFLLSRRWLIFYSACRSSWITKRSTAIAKFPSTIARTGRWVRTKRNSFQAAAAPLTFYCF
jgi:Helicase associated domain